jgi:5-methylcytosine-specific restriction endonuclease McrA
VATKCQRCNGTGRYHRGSVNSFCYSCNGHGVIVQKRRLSVARIEQQLANLQDEKARLLDTQVEDEAEHARLSERSAQFFEPIRHMCGIPSDVVVAETRIEQEIRSRREAVTAARKKDSALKLLGPLAKDRRKAILDSIDALEADIATLQSFPPSLSSINETLLRQQTLFNRRRRLESIDRTVARLQKDLASTERQPEVKMHKLRLRAATTERENREAVERFRSELAKTETCPYCRQAIADFHLDHIVPVSYGGRPCRENLVWVCAPCNLKKRDLTLLEFTDKFGLDYLVILRRLQSLGKRV